MLRWRLAANAPDNLGGLAPGLIDWLTRSTHTAAEAFPEASLVEFAEPSPDPLAVKKCHAALGVTLEVGQAGNAAVTLVIDTPKGRVALW